MLLDHGADIAARDNEGATALHYATKSSEEDVIQFVLDQGCDIESTDNLGRLALHIAIKYVMPEACEFLLKNGADVSRPCDGNGRAPLILAVDRPFGSEEIIALLLDYGADVALKFKGRSAWYRKSSNSAHGKTGIPEFDQTREQLANYRKFRYPQGILSKVFAGVREYERDKASHQRVHF